MNDDLLGQAAREALGETKRKCSALNRDGQPCGRAPILGGFVCDRHGGKIPSVVRSAKNRLLAMADPAVAALEKVLTSHGPPCEVCGRSDADRDPVVVRAAQIVLDRTGYGPQATLALHAVPEPAPWTQWLTDAQLAQIGDWIDEAKARMEAGEAPPVPVPLVLDAVCVEDDAEPISAGAIPSGDSTRDE